MSFCSAEGILYYMPSLIRSSLANIEEKLDFENFIFHVKYSGTENKIFNKCNHEKRQFISRFLDYMIQNYSEYLKSNFCEKGALKAQELWSQDNKPS